MKGRIIAVLGLAAWGLSAGAGAAPLALADDTVCAWALQQITGSEVLADTQVFDSYDTFKGTKAEALPLRVKQYRSPRGAAVSVACKMSSVEGLVEKGGIPVEQLGEQRSCRFAHERMLEQVYRALPAEERRLSPKDIVLEEDETTWMGPQWLRPDPYPALVRSDRGVWHLRAKSLAVGNAWYIPLPASIKGVHYCTLVAPEYLRKVLKGG